MPLVRVEVRNEFKLGMREMYKDEEDPKALLDGVVVAGLVGILRQLGDLAEFAADVFHGLQEQVTNTSSRSHKLMVHARKIEAAFSPLEKSILAQRSHLHFAYTTGSHWHAHIQSEQNHFIYSDLPLFVMDSYEECRGPPRLHLLDKFDPSGPGSCLKKYSDPTFFRKASAGFDEAYAEKFPRHKKARKKKRRWIPNGDELQHVNHGTPTFSHSGRLHYASQNFHSLSQTFSTYDAPVKFEKGNHLTPSDSRTASGYGECVFKPSNTSKFDGCEPEEISSRWMINHSDTLDTFSLDEQIRVVDDDIQEQTGARSSCITWHEKTEIVEPTGSQYHFDETMEGHPMNFDPILFDGDAFKFETDYCSNKSMPISDRAAHQPDEYESETDINMDPRNTMESESEIDLECQTKREVEQFSDVNTKAINGILNRINQEHMENNSAVVASQVLARISTNVTFSEDNNFVAIGSSFVQNEETFIAKPISVTPEGYAKVQSPRDTGKSSTLDSLPSSDLIESDDITSSNIETAVSNLSSFESREPVVQDLKSDTVLSSAYGSQESSSVPSGVTGTNFWTNGGLLGLQPSKPPDFSALSHVNHDSAAPSRRGNILEGKEIASETNTSEGFKMCQQNCSPKCTILLFNNQEDSVSIMKTSLSSSQTHSDSNHEHTANNLHNHNQLQNLLSSETSIMVPGTDKQDSTDVEAAKYPGYFDKKSSRMLELSNKLPGNGQGPVFYFGEDNPHNSFTTGISERQSVHQAFQTFSGRTFIEQFGSGSPLISPSSSPPLEHMKISLQPIEGVAVSKLKLDYLGRSESHESSRDVFPSFQLVPEESHSLQDLDSDSDDTFCDSSTHGSDDCLSHYSVSYSEEWETVENPRCNDSNIYDALCRNSVESVSSNLDVGRIALGVITNISGLPNLYYEEVMEHSQTELPSFDTLDDSIREELHNDSEAKYEIDSESFKHPTLPPPFPPTEWCVMNQNLDMATENQVCSSQAVKLAFNQKLLTFTISQQQKLAPDKQENTETIACATNRKHLDGQKVKLQNDANQSPKSKVADENEDFLEQIKKKSLSLRRTIIERPNLGPGVPANIAVTAILEKADAIRQAVGSDETEDNDSWSD